VISFDGDGTLWNFIKVMKHSLKCVLKELEKFDSKSASLLNVDKMIVTREKVAQKLKGVETNLEKIRLESFKESLREIGRPDDDLATHLNHVYRKHRFEDLELYDDVKETLETLKDRYIIGLLSNGNSYPKKIGLEGIFQFVVFSQDFGVEKPDPKIFQIVLDKTGCKRNELLHVGDSVEDDVVGAKKAGVEYLWLNMIGLKQPSFIESDHVIKSLKEILKLLN
jgi:putative hydrolase of the HAD superfamily